MTAIIPLLMLVLGACSMSPDAPGWRTVYADTEWYREHPGPEAVWSGVLQAREQGDGPGDRPALRYELVRAGHQALPIYAPEPAPALEELVARRVRVRAKLTDLRAEGFGLELWVGYILPADGEP